MSVIERLRPAVAELAAVGCEVRDEWAVRLTWTDGSTADSSWGTREEADGRVALHLAGVASSPRVRVGLLYRLVITTPPAEVDIEVAHSPTAPAGSVSMPRTATRSCAQCWLGLGRVVPTGDPRCPHRGRW